MRMVLISDEDIDRYTHSMMIVKVVATMHNGPAVNQNLLKIEQAQTNLKWSILTCDFQKYSSQRVRI